MDFARLGLPLPPLVACARISSTSPPLSCTLSSFVGRGGDRDRGISAPQFVIMRSSRSCDLMTRREWADARIKIARMTLTIRLDGNWKSFQPAISASPINVTDNALAPSARLKTVTGYPVIQKTYSKSAVALSRSH